MRNIFVKTILELIPKKRAVELLEDYRNCEIGDDFKKAYRNTLDRHRDMEVNNESIDLFVNALEIIKWENNNVKKSK